MWLPFRSVLFHYAPGKNEDRLAAWHHFYLLLRLRYRLNKLINPLVVLCCYFRGHVIASDWLLTREVVWSPDDV